MSVEIKYKGNTIASANTDVTKTIKTSGKYCEADIIVENTPDSGADPVINPLSVTANGTYTAPSGVDGYSPVTVNVPQGITPTGNINITDTNVTDVTNYATAQVVDADLVASNIKKDVNILGILGTFEGGGGTLPSSISKIDGGSFTPVNDVSGMDNLISHSLGEAPKGYHIWCTDLNTFTTGTAGRITNATGVNQDRYYNATGIDYGYVEYLVRNANGSNTFSIAGNASSEAKANMFNASTFAVWARNIHFEANCTYHWIAWA